MVKRRLLGALELLLLTVLLLLLIAPEWPAFGDERYRLNSIVGPRQFDFLIWEVEAFLAKGQAILSGDQSYLDEQTRQEIVLSYLSIVDRVRQLDRQINDIYTSPDIEEPEIASRELQEELATERQTLAEIQPLAEAIIQEQVAVELVRQGFSLAGQAWPPVLMHMTPLPAMLVVSPRDHIESEYQVPLVHGLSTPVYEKLETAVFDDLDMASLVVPVGGIGTYPAMIMETASINWLTEVTAHEWTHNWLTLQPLGVSYGLDPQVRIINETVASMVDREIRDGVIEQFYPEYMPQPPPETPPAEETRPDPDEPPPFDFRAEMAATRIRVDELLEAGEIEEAEAYMEARRQEFVANGYLIRKLNQAYFAFYGAYASEPGATGGDPIGPMLGEIRAHSPSLRDFLETVAPITSFEDLEDVYQQALEEKR